MITKRTIIVGDVHGCLDELDELLRLANYNKSHDRLVFVGDLVDRGPDPRGVVRRVMELQAESVMGNHEEKLLRWARHEAKRRATGRPNPMKPPKPQRLAEWESMSETELRWLSSLPLSLDLGDGWLVVHAGFEPGRKLNDQRADKIIRVRYVDKVGEMVPYKDGEMDQPPDTVYWTEQWKGPSSVVYGHAVHDTRTPRIDKTEESVCIGIDTGCCFGGSLTAMILGGSHFQFVQVQAAKRYHDHPKIQSLV